MVDMILGEFASTPIAFAFLRFVLRPHILKRETSGGSLFSCVTSMFDYTDSFFVSLSPTLACFMGMGRMARMTSCGKVS